MRKTTALAVASLALTAACADGSGTAGVTPPASKLVRLDRTAASDVIPGAYLVIYDDDVADPEAKTKEKALKLKAKKVKHSYTSAVKGFAADLTEEEVAALSADPDVAYIEPDQVVTIDATQSGATWGLDRIDQRNRPLSGTYTYTSTGSGVRVYIIDTGILTTHPQFGTRASNVYDGVGGNGTDCNGHGTHVAGTVGSTTYGVAKGSLLRGVRVFTCTGSSANSTIVAGIDWVRANHVKPAVANLSLGGGFSTTTNTAVNNLATAGVLVVVAAGNENQDACNVSPASAANVVTVASSTSSDAKSSFSNYGGCVDLYAPGSSITSTWLNNGTNTISGTSMASPHVAGVGALYKATNGDASYSTIRTWLINNATANVITGNVSGTPNRLLFKGTL